jgi:hypothetical protein
MEFIRFSSISIVRGVVGVLCGFYFAGAQPSLSPKCRNLLSDVPHGFKQLHEPRKLDHQ